MSDDQTPKPRLTKESLKVFTSDLPPRVPESNKTYPFDLTIAGPRHGIEFQWAPASKGKAFFEDLRNDQALIVREEGLKRHLEKEGVKNYKAERGDTAVVFFFATQHDRNLAKMAFLKKGPYVIEYTPESPDVPFKQARKRMFKLRDEYRNSGNSGGVHFQMDRNDKTFFVIARNRRAYVDFLGDSCSIILPTMR